MRAPRRGRRAKSAAVQGESQSARSDRYRQLRHPFAPQTVFSADAVGAMHQKALQVLKELGIKVLLPEARLIMREAGALVDENTEIVRLGEEIVAEALQTAPRSFRMRAASPEHEQMFQAGALLYAPGAGCPNAYDLKRGRRPGTLKDFEETIKLQQSFNVIHLFGPAVEPQDVPAKFRHYEMMRAQLVYGDKPMFIYARGRQQVQESFDLIQTGLDLTEADLSDGVWATTVINTNSPRQIDVPMAEGIIDFARAGQLSVMTPFCLAGAMAPITIAGALVLQHAESLAAISLAQMTRPGAPVAYGGFSSNVDMRSGAPAFGTPEHVKLTIGSGQLARYVGLPWRSASGTSSNIADMQAASETNMGLWAAVLANTTLTLHAAGWLEGGLCFGYEKFINDIEALQTIAELCQPTPEDDASLAWSALADVEPGGHFFATPHTMERYRDAFYSPLVADLRNFGAWSDGGGQSSTQRATKIWETTLKDFVEPEHGWSANERIRDKIESFMAKGGAPPAGG